MYFDKEIKPFGEKAVFHHIGICIASIDKISESFVKDEVQGVYISFINMNNMLLEFISPIDDTSPVSQSLKKGNKLLHMCFEVPSLEKAIESSKNFGFRAISKPVIAKAFKKNIVWLYNSTYGLIELVEM